MSIHNIFRAGLILIVVNFTSIAAKFANQPDFADYRRVGKVVRSYSTRPEHRRYGVTLQIHGKNVHALGDGIVHSAGVLRGYGNFVIVDHGKGWHSLYSNLGHISVKKGQRVSRGDVLANVHNKRLFLVVSYRGNPINPSDLS